MGEKGEFQNRVFEIFFVSKNSLPKRTLNIPCLKDLAFLSVGLKAWPSARSRRIIGTYE
jgi:hypothetical protein